MHYVQVWFKNRRAKFRKKQRASKSHIQRADSSPMDGGTSTHCKTKDEATDRRRGQRDSCFSSHDDASSAPDTAPLMTSDSVDDDDDDEEQGRLQGDDQILPSSLAVFQGDVRRRFSTMTDAGSADSSRISELAFRGLHPFHLHGQFTENFGYLRPTFTAVTSDHPSSEGGIMFSGIRLCVCLSECLSTTSLVSCCSIHRLQLIACSPPVLTISLHVLTAAKDIISFNSHSPISSFDIAALRYGLRNGYMSF